VVILRLMHWDHAQYVAAPQQLLDLIMPTIVTENTVAELKQKNSQNRSGSKNGN
jgi:hypothetical protein